VIRTRAIKWECISFAKFMRRRLYEGPGCALMVPLHEKLNFHRSWDDREWKNIDQPLEALPECFVEFAIRKRKLAGAPTAQTDRSPRRQRVSERLATVDGPRSPPAWSEGEEARIRSALEFIPADNRDDAWLRVGAALHWTGWNEKARGIWDGWSKTSDKYNPADQDKAWNSFSRPYEGRPITLGTLYRLAKQHGYEEAPTGEIAELNARHFLIRNIGGKCLVGEMVGNSLGSGRGAFQARGL
jgi:Primase C terminal 2 (PriCT-2)